MSKLSAEQKCRIRRIERVYCGVQALLWLSVSLPAALAILLLQARGLDLFEIGLALSVFSLVVAVLEVPSGVWADTIGRKRVNPGSIGAPSLKKKRRILASVPPIRVFSSAGGT